ncbi:hypothetical protein BHM03_00015740 [Ensete ventricosum]|uniref:Uncharacterized protein n=1 Tax=Ensete ventricosum TaxID=4639 RepID=A0A445MEH4_ENSVE|nr:hypothetical protein BHM03_00015740 [Ensete ventricosum]
MTILTLASEGPRRGHNDIGLLTGKRATTPSRRDARSRPLGSSTFTRLLVILVSSSKSWPCGQNQVRRIKRLRHEMPPSTLEMEMIRCSLSYNETYVGERSPAQIIVVANFLDLIAVGSLGGPLGGFVVDDLGVGQGPGVLDDGAADGVDPLLFLLLSIGDEVHGLGPGGDLEGEGTVEDVLGALDGEAGGDGDDAARGGGAGDVGVLEPEELPLLQHEPPAAPRLDVLPLLCQPPRPLRVRPERYTSLLLRRGGRPSEHRPPQARRHGLAFLLAPSRSSPSNCGTATQIPTSCPKGLPPLSSCSSSRVRENLQCPGTGDLAPKPFLSVVRSRKWGPSTMTKEEITFGRSARATTRCMRIHSHRDRGSHARAELSITCTLRRRKHHLPHKRAAPPRNETVSRRATV